MANASEAATATVTNGVLKFVIGFFAGICAAFIPRLGPILTTDTSRLLVFPAEYIVVGVVFGMLIGGIMVILEYGVPKPPKETFVAALGIPALVAGALNTASNANELKAVARQQSAQTQSLVQQLEIPILPAAAAPRPLLDLPARPGGASLLDWLPGVSNAHAGGGSGSQTSPGGFNASIQVQQQQYVIVLEEAGNRQQALARAEELRGRVPQAQAVKGDQGYLVIQGGAPKTEGAAIADVVRLRNEAKVQPKLLPVK